MLAGLMVETVGAVAITPTLMINLSTGAKAYHVKTGDTNRYLFDVLKHEGRIVDLTGCSVAVLITNNDGVDIRAVATLSDAENGEVTYYPDVSDFLVAGNYDVEWEVTFPNTLIATFPAETYRKLTINQDRG